MKYFYDLIFLLFSIVYLPYLAIKGKAHKDFLQRFGFLPRHLKGTRKDAIWVHTVSVGEVLASVPFIKQLKEAFPEKRIILSTTTRTGNEAAQRLFGEVIPKFYFPVDLHFIVEKIIDFINPFGFILFETEIWPNLILCLSKRKIPIILINGRISDRSFKGYRLIKLVFTNILKRIDKFMMQTELDAERIKFLGAPSENIKVCGNVKYDIVQATSCKPQATDLDKKNLGITENEELIICGSTHKGEEEILLQVYKELLKDFTSLHLLIAPRHIDRIGEIEKLCTRYGFDSIRLSKINAQRTTHNAQRIFLLDTIGQLSQFYNIATIVFMGGSLVKRGGHNLVEPARFDKPIIFGPHMSNFRDMAFEFLRKDAAVMVKNREELKKTLNQLLKDKSKMLEIGRNAANLVKMNKGAVSKIIEEIKDTVSEM